jgi:hypothetical protein
MKEGGEETPLLYKMKGAVWIYAKNKDNVEYRFQVDGLKRGVYTKIIDPVFKDWHQVGTGYNYKESTETLIFSKPFTSEDDMILWVKNTVSFPTIYNKCNAKCTIKVLVADKNEVKDASSKRATKVKSTTSGTVRKSKTTA